MRAPKYKRDFWWARWEGGVSDVAEITRLAEKLVGNVRNNVTVEIRVETPIVDTEYLDVNEFESHVADSELEAIRSISVHAYDGGESGWNIKLWFGKRSPVVLLHVSGSEPTFVVGPHNRFARRSTIDATEQCLGRRSSE